MAKETQAHPNSVAPYVAQMTLRFLALFCILSSNDPVADMKFDYLNALTLLLVIAAQMWDAVNQEMRLLMVILCLAMLVITSGRHSVGSHGLLRVVVFVALCFAVLGVEVRFLRADSDYPTVRHILLPVSVAILVLHLILVALRLRLPELG